SVWLPGGGYSPNAWRALAGTALVLSGEDDPIPETADPLTLEFSRIGRELRQKDLEGELEITTEDLMESLGQRKQPHRFLDYYTVEGLEYALYRYGVLQHLRRLGYGDFRIAIDRSSAGDRMRLFAKADDAEHLLYEV